MDFKKFLEESHHGEGLLRIIQESVPGREVTLAHVIASPKPIVYRKLGLNPNIDFDKAAIGIIKMTSCFNVVFMLCAGSLCKRSFFDIPSPNILYHMIM